MNSKFIVLSVKNESGNIEAFLVNKFYNNNELDYFIVGKVDELCSLDKINDLKRIISELDELFEEKVSVSEYQKRFEKIKKLAGFDEIKFTQEGYDLLSGKNHYLNNIIPKTLTIDYVDAENKLFGNTYSVNEDVKVKRVDGEISSKDIEIFDDWTIYETYYLLNPVDLESTNVESIKFYMEENYYKVINMLNICYPNWTKNHWNTLTEQEQKDNLVQLADVINTFSQERNSR